MHRIDTPGSFNSTFLNGNPFASQEGTIVGAAWLNALQEEVSKVVEEGGLLLDKQDNGQLFAALNLLATSLSGARQTFTAPSGLTAGDVFVLGDLVGVIETTVLVTELATLLLGGPHSVIKSSGDTFSTVGAIAYWDPSLVQVKGASATGRRQIGTFAETAGLGKTVINVRLDGVGRVAAP